MVGGGCFGVTSCSRVPTDQAKNKNESFKMKFHVTNVRLSCLSDLVRNRETERIAKLPTQPGSVSRIMKATVP